jgi:hypothetical protein
MTRRTIPGVGSADYSPEEEHLVRELIAKGWHNEVLLLHELKVQLDASPVESDPAWERRRAAVERERDASQMRFGS